MKNLILLIIVFLSNPLFSQNFENKISVIEMESLNEKYENFLDEYTSSFSNHVYRNRTLDSFARGRNMYFISLINGSLKDGRNPKDIIRSIAGGASGHKRNFGNPYFFKEGLDSKYFDLNSSFNKENLKINGEIMYNCYFWFKEKNNLDESSIVNRFVKKYTEDHKNDDFILDAYRRSYSHNEAIVKYGNGEIGTSTTIIINKIKNPESEYYEYSVILENITVFSKKIRR